MTGKERVNAVPAFPDGPWAAAAEQVLRWTLVFGVLKNDRLGLTAEQIDAGLSAKIAGLDAASAVREMRGLEALRRADAAAKSAIARIALMPEGCPARLREDALLVGRFAAAARLASAQAIGSPSDGSGADAGTAIMILDERMQQLAARTHAAIVEDRVEDDWPEITRLVDAAKGGDSEAVHAGQALLAALSDERLGGSVSALAESDRQQIVKGFRDRLATGVPTPPEDLETVLAELDGLIGLTGVKAQVHRLASFLRVQRQREAKGLKTSGRSLHMVFVGAPGTGKTTIARLVARILHSLGYLERGQLIEASRADLVAEYVGQTAVKTNAVVDSALGGVLFVDEAYALAPEGAGNDFGAEAVSTLLARMENEREELVVIVAGYPDEMERLMRSNAGLRSRFDETIVFDDYSPAELSEIFCRMVEAAGYVLDDAARSVADAHFEAAHAARSSEFGNARLARNLFEDGLANQAVRLDAVDDPSAEELSLLTADDIRGVS